MNEVDGDEEILVDNMKVEEIQNEIYRIDNDNKIWKRK